jgi:prepilin-type N-terminal cleavage/methylation domain-containing protein
VASGRKRRAGFTLTEMLMAAGILGIGLTMVASIFPVAVEQSRRSRDQTMAALCARSVLAQTRAGQNAIYNGLRGKTEAFVDLNSTVVYRPSVFLYTKARTYAGVGTWDTGNYVARLFATPTRIGGPWRIAIFVCRSTGKSPYSYPADDDLWANAVNPTPGAGTYVVEKWRGGAIGHLLDYVLTDQTDKTGYFAVGANSRDEPDNDKILPAATDIQRVPNAVAVFHAMVGE